MHFSTSKIIDLTHPIAPKMPVFPGDPECTLEPHASFETDGYRVTRLSFGSHMGTHLDAPSHFLASGTSVDMLPLQQLCGPATLIELRTKGAAGALIDVPDLAPYASVLLPQARVLLYTGWDEYYGSEAFFADSPGLTPDACRWLAAKGLAVLGLDLPTLHPTEFAETHVPLLEAGTVVVESLRLGRLTPYADKPFMFGAMPLPLIGVDGSPVRAFAIVPHDPDPEVSAEGTTPSVRVEPVQSARQMLDAFFIRDTVFVNEQGVAMAEEHDDLDKEALHVLAYADGTPVGTLRLLREGTTAKVGRFAVLKEYRGRGIGRELMAWVIRCAPAFGLTKLVLHAQTYAAEFYRKAGFEVCGPEFMEAGIPHLPMERKV